MTPPVQKNICNSFLRAMLPEDFALLSVDLVWVDLPRRMVLVEENRIIDHVYFPESGLASIVSLTPDREMIETAVFGFEGASNFVIDPGEDRVPLRTFMQVSGAGWRIGAAAFSEAVNGSQTLLKIVTRYDQYKCIQMAYTALSHGSFTIPERLARWVLMAHDRLGDDIKIAHEHLAMMLGVRRAGVTEALHVLEGHQALKSTRGAMQVLNRDKLVSLAAGSYGVPEAEYRRLIGSMERLTP